VAAAVSRFDLVFEKVSMGRARTPYAETLWKARHENGSIDDPVSVVPAPLGWRPRDAIAAAFPAIAEFTNLAQAEILAVEARLGRQEALGLDTSSLRLALRELRWRLEYTADVSAARIALARLRRLAGLSSLPAGLPRDASISHGASTVVWFLKLDASVDHWLADGVAVDADPQRLLDRVNDPGRLAAYLRSLLVSRPAEDGIDRRKELNFATAGLVRLILRSRPPGYPWDPRLAEVIRGFVADWQDPNTGFFGADYEIRGQRYRTADLSLTFHMARYLQGKIRYWPQLVDTLLAMRDARYPNGWLDEGGMTNHNNYDVATLLRFGWPEMRADQRRRASCELDRLLHWCLETAVAADGTVVARAVAESLPESYYFTIAFLDTVGYFDPRERFWTDRAFAGAAGLRAQLAARLAAFDPNEPMTRLAVGRLRDARGSPPSSGGSAA
jgi:hypothetical protein